MPYRPPLKCPTLDFLQDVERTFSVAWPESFRRFCTIHSSSELNEKYPSLKGTFIRDFEELEKTNVLIGEGSWGDYEQAIAKKRLPKDGRTLYLDLLPFYVEKKEVYGFLTADSGGDKVVVWAVHTFVHDYPTFDDWLSREGSHSRPKKKPRFSR
jgi:hypothetical protein